MIRKIALGTLVTIFCFLPVSVLAQANDSFSITATPEYPKEYTQTTISIESFSTDLDRSKTTWKENGVVVAQEVGLKTKTFTAPGNGTSKTVSVEVTTPAGYKLNSQYTLTPQAIDLLWEAPDSYIPPFYRGKALAGEQSIVRVVAIPNFTKKGVLQDRDQTVYNWTKNNTQPEGVSGYGKSSFTFRLDPLKSSENIKLNVGTLNGDTQVEEKLNIRPVPTRVIFYETSPLLGTIFGQAFTTGLNLITNEITLVAEPYFFSGASDIRGNNSFVWNVGGGSVKNGSDPMRITLKKPGTPGKTDIAIKISHITKVMQEAGSKIFIVYDK